MLLVNGYEMKPVIAYIDDDFHNLNFYKYFLSTHFEVEIFHSSNDLMNAIQTKTFDCFILDINMPGMSGFEVFEAIRAIPDLVKTPVFLITTSPSDEVKIKSYQNGAADFFDRFIKREELIARLEARINDYRNTRSQISVGNLLIDFHKVECYLNRERIILTLIEFKIVAYLLKIFPKKYTKDELVDAIWGKEIVSSNTINTHLSNLRTKLADWCYEIDHIRGKGFHLKPK